MKCRTGRWYSTRGKPYLDGEAAARRDKGHVRSHRRTCDSVPELSGSLPAAWHKKQGGVGEATMWLSCQEG